MAENMVFVSFRSPYLKVTIKVLNRNLKTDALVDTGFSGEVVLPPEMIMNGQPPKGYSRWTLADGSTKLAPNFLGTARIGKFKPIDVSIAVLGDEPIIGRGIIDRFRVIFDHGKKVIVEQ